MSKKITRNVIEIYKRIYYPKSKRCIFCPKELKPCPIDDLCPCPWRNAKLDIAKFIKQIQPEKEPIVINKRNVFNL